MTAPVQIIAALQARIAGQDARTAELERSGAAGNLSADARLCGVVRRQVFDIPEI